MAERALKDLRFHLYKTKASLHLDFWPEKGTTILKLAPAIEGKSKGQPEKGSTQYNYDKAITISFSYMDLLKASYKLTALSYGEDTTYQKFGDLSKIEDKDLEGTKKLNISAASYTAKGKEINIVSVNLSLDKENISISLDLEEAYALAKHFEYTYQFCLGKSLTGELNRTYNGDK